MSKLVFWPNRRPRFCYINEPIGKLTYEFQVQILDIVIITTHGDFFTATTQHKRKSRDIFKRLLLIKEVHTLVADLV